MSKESLDLPPVLAAPPRRSRRHRIAVAATVTEPDADIYSITFNPELWDVGGGR